MTIDEAVKVHRRESRRVGRNLPYREFGQSEVMTAHDYVGGIGPTRKCDDPKCCPRG